MGFSGSSGSVGPTGPQGPAGDDGAPGATGPAGSANIEGTSGKLVKFTGAEVGGDSIVSESGGAVTVAGALTDLRTGLADTVADGLLVTNTTAATAIATVQRPGVVRHEGRAWSTGSGGSNSTVAVEERLVPVSNVFAGVDREVRYDTPHASGRIYRDRSDVTSIGGPGIEVDGTIMLTGNSSGVRGTGAGNPGLAITGSNDAQLKAGSGRVQLGTAGVDRVTLALDGSYTHELPVGLVHRLLWGKVAIDRVGNYTTTADATEATIASYTAADESVYLATATFTAWKDNTDYGSWVRRGTFKRDGGTLSQQGSTQTIGADETSAGFSGFVIVLDASGTAIRGRVQGAATWGVVFEIQVLTP